MSRRGPGQGHLPALLPVPSEGSDGSARKDFEGLVSPHSSVPPSKSFLFQKLLQALLSFLSPCNCLGCGHKSFRLLMASHLQGLSLHQCLKLCSRDLSKMQIWWHLPESGPSLTSGCP